VIDVNLPQHVTDPDDKQEHEASDAVEYRIKEAERLTTYLWDNYIEVSDATHVFLMGTNTGHGGIIKFIKANEDRAQERITGIVSFVEDVPLQSCKSVTNEFLAQWYFDVSQTFVSQEHNWWTSEYVGKIRKRFGKPVHSALNSISDMLVEHKTAVFDFLSQRTADWVDDEPPTGDQKLDDGDCGVTTPEKSKLPPVGNFALSPRPLVQPATNSPSRHVRRDLFVASPPSRRSPAPKSPIR
jgi:histone deacetylase 6